MLIVDKSSSMEGRKMELARLASIGVVDNLRPIDTVGVLQFDNTFEWAVPIRKVDNKTLINRLIGGITPTAARRSRPRWPRPTTASCRPRPAIATSCCSPTAFPRKATLWRWRVRPATTTSRFRRSGWDRT